MDDYTLALILKSYENITAKTVGGTIYGIPIERDDQIMLVVAAYFLGRSEGSNQEREASNEREKLTSLHYSLFRGIRRSD